MAVHPMKSLHTHKDIGKDIKEVANFIMTKLQRLLHFLSLARNSLTIKMKRFQKMVI